MKEPLYDGFEKFTTEADIISRNARNLETAGHLANIENDNVERDEEGNIDKTKKSTQKDLVQARRLKKVVETYNRAAIGSKHNDQHLRYEQKIKERGYGAFENESVPTEEENVKKDQVWLERVQNEIQVEDQNKIDLKNQVPTPKNNVEKVQKEQNKDTIKNPVTQSQYDIDIEKFKRYQIAEGRRRNKDLKNVRSFLNSQKLEKRRGQGYDDPLGDSVPEDVPDHEVESYRYQENKPISPIYGKPKEKSVEKPKNEQHDGELMPDISPVEGPEELFEGEIIEPASKPEHKPQEEAPKEEFIELGLLPAQELSAYFDSIKDKKQLKEELIQNYDTRNEALKSLKALHEKYVAEKNQAQVDHITRLFNEQLDVVKAIKKRYDSIQSPFSSKPVNSKPNQPKNPVYEGEIMPDKPKQEKHEVFEGEIIESKRRTGPSASTGQPKSSKKSAWSRFKNWISGE